MEKKYQVGVYIRLSREDGDDRESESVENQRDIINKFIEEREELEFVDEYVDDGFTGTNFDRPSFRKMKTDIEYKNERCVRYFTKGFRPSIPCIWRNIKLIQYEYKNQELVYKEI